MGQSPGVACFGLPRGPLPTGLMKEHLPGSLGMSGPRLVEAVGGRWSGGELVRKKLPFPEVRNSNF